MHHDENTAAAVQAKRDPAIFLVTVRGIKDGERLRIMENRGSPLKTNAMVAQIVLGLDGIPRKNYRNASPQLHDIMVFPPPQAPNARCQPLPKAGAQRTL